MGSLQKEQDRLVNRFSSGSKEWLCKDSHEAVDMKNEVEMDQYITLDELPSEILLHVFSFLSAREVSETVSCVCRRFHELLQDPTTWRLRVESSVKGHYLRLDLGDEEEFPWRYACSAVETEHQRWTSCQASMQEVFNYRHYSVMDTCCLMKNGLLAVGSRDYRIMLWDVNRLKENRNPSKKLLPDFTLNEYEGWVWTLDCHEDLLVSGGWDSRIVLWDVNRLEAVVAKNKHRVAILCSTLQQNLLAVGAYDSKVLMYDPRQGLKAISFYTPNKKAVLSIASDDKYIISGGEDGQSSVWCKRTKRPLKTFRVSSDAYVSSIWMGSREVILGDSKGIVHVMDPNHPEFAIVKSDNVGHTDKVTKVIGGYGSLLTASRDGSIKVHSPSWPAKTWATLSDETKPQCVGTAYRQGVLACTYHTNFLKVWAPSEVTV
ncbi:F-box/WD repeat-containing protein 9-like isoform X2 [Oratosquilla oratoria]